MDELTIAKWCGVVLSVVIVFTVLLTSGEHHE